MGQSVATAFDDGNPESEDPIACPNSRPDFAILFYPVISMEKEVTHPGSNDDNPNPTRHFHRIILEMLE